MLRNSFVVYTWCDYWAHPTKSVARLTKYQRHSVLQSSWSVTTSAMGCCLRIISNRMVFFFCEIHLFMLSVSDTRTPSTAISKSPLFRPAL